MASFLIGFIIWLVITALIFFGASKIAINDKCYREGKMARKMGANLSFNPYKRYSTEWIYWYNGWMDGRTN